MGVPINPTSALLAASLPQSDFNTTLAPATSPKNFRQIVIDGYGVIPDYESPNVGNDNEATGSAYSTKNNKGRADAKSSFNLRLSYDGLGFWAYRSFGVYSVVLVATGVYRHTFKLLNPQVSQDLPAFVLAAKTNEAALASNEGYDYKFRGTKVESFGVSIPHSADKPYLRGDVALQGSGKRDAGTDVLFYGSSRTVFNSTDLAGEQDIPENGTMTLYPQPSKAGTPYAAGCDFYDFNAKINNNLNLEVGYMCRQFQNPSDASSAQVRGSLPTTKQMAEVSFSSLLTPELKAGMDFETLRESGAKLSAEWNFGGKVIGASAYNYNAKFSLNAFTIGGITYPEINSLNGIMVTTKPEAIGSVMPLELEILSSVPDYSVFAG